MRDGTGLTRGGERFCGKSRELRALGQSLYVRKTNGGFPYLWARRRPLEKSKILPIFIDSLAQGSADPNEIFITIL